MRSKSTRIICGNCEYWTGGRSLGPLSESGEAQTDHKGIGKCLCRESRFIDIERKSDQRCKNFHRWAVICQKP